jgi:hypothetical protein
MTVSAIPCEIFSAPSVIAWLDVAQARMTEYAEVFFGSPASNTTSRAMFGRSTEGMTAP